MEGWVCDGIGDRVDMGWNGWQGGCGIDGRVDKGRGG